MSGQIYHVSERSRFRSFAILLMRVLAVACFIGMLFALCDCGMAAPCDLWESETMRRIAAEYRLSGEQTRMLFAVRRVENGRPGSGLEFGIGQHFPRHPARRFAAYPELSFIEQARWAAGTIAKRYRKPSDLQAFSKRYSENPRYAELIRRAKK